MARQTICFCMFANELKIRLVVIEAGVIGFVSIMASKTVSAISFYMSFYEVWRDGLVAILAGGWLKKGDALCMTICAFKREIVFCSLMSG